MTRPSSTCRSRCCQVYCPIIVGSALILFSVVALSYMPDIFEKIIRKKVVLKPDGETFTRWFKSPVKIQYKVHLFEVLNTQEILQNGSIPQLRERGPYTYTQERFKEIEKWSDDGTRLWYKEFKGFFFDRNNSVGDVSDVLTIVNVPMNSINGRLDPILDAPLVGWFLSGFVNQAMRGFGEGLFVTKTVDELLFRGYKINLLEPANLIDREVVPGNAFALFYRRNMTWNPKRDGIMGIYTGVGNTSDRYTETFEFNDKPTLGNKWWGGPESECNRVHGTSGTQFHPFINRSETLYSYTTDICRAVPLKFVRETDVVGIPAWRFSPPRSSFSSPTINPRNRCFCNHRDEDVHRYCDYNGVLDISNCIGGAPILVSAPHLLNADDFIRETFHGLNPDPELHTTYVDIEPMTGQVIRARRRLQLNVRVKKSSLRQFDQLYDAIFPVAWIEESGEIDQTLADQYQAKLFRPIRILKLILVGLILLGVCFLFVPFLFCLGRISKRRYKKIRSRRATNTKRGSARAAAAATAARLHPSAPFGSRDAKTRSALSSPSPSSTLNNQMPPSYQSSSEFMGSETDPIAVTTTSSVTPIPADNAGRVPSADSAASGDRGEGASPGLGSSNTTGTRPPRTSPSTLSAVPSHLRDRTDSEIERLEENERNQQLITERVPLTLHESDL